MAKVGFTHTTPESRKHIILDDCSQGDIIFLEEDQMFGIVSDFDSCETEITNLLDGTREWFSSETQCRKFVGEINFNVNDFEEFS